MAETKGLAHYKRLPYTRVVELRQAGDGRVYYLARIHEIPFIRVEGDTREEALYRLAESFDDVVTSMIEVGDDIPKPTQWPGPISVQDRLELQVEHGQSKSVAKTRAEGAEEETVNDPPEGWVDPQTGPRVLTGADH